MPSNKDIVLEFTHSGLEKWDAAVVNRVMKPDVIQHNPQATGGRQGLLEMFKVLPEPMQYQVWRVLEDGDLVVVHGTVKLIGQTFAVFDVYRLENRQIAEHWDSLQPLPSAPNPSGRSMLDGPTTISNLDQTEANKALIQRFYQQIFVGGHFDQIGAYFDGNTYLQHNPGVADGLSSLLNASAAAAKAGKGLKVDTVSRILGEGNFVYVRSGGEFGGQRVVFSDLYRIQNGKIAEHWDVIQPVPAESPNLNGML
ncbi:MAG: nuclear transport factor 2 family protein [Thermaceae bacterium]|nr:nuclear transport factor 2 family protein [Thermaceae bacterium]